MQNVTWLLLAGLAGVAFGTGLGLLLARSGIMDEMAAGAVVASAAAAAPESTPDNSKDKESGAQSLLGGPAVPAEGAADAESARVIAATLQQFVAGWNAHDRARMAPIFPERYIDLTVADPVIHGPTQIDHFLAMAERSGARLAITQQELWVSGDIAADYGLVEQTAPDEVVGEGEGDAPAYRLRYLNVWRRTDADGWRIYWSMEIPEPGPWPDGGE